jgi:hypothetical protein
MKEYNTEYKSSPGMSFVGVGYDLEYNWNITGIQASPGYHWFGVYSRTAQLIYFQQRPRIPYSDMIFQ